MNNNIQMIFFSWVQISHI